MATQRKPRKRTVKKVETKPVEKPVVKEHPPAPSVEEKIFIERKPIKQNPQNIQDCKLCPKCGSKELRVDSYDSGLAKDNIGQKEAVFCRKCNHYGPTIERTVKNQDIRKEAYKAWNEQ